MPHSAAKITSAKITSATITSATVTSATTTDAMTRGVVLTWLTLLIVGLSSLSALAAPPVFTGRADLDFAIPGAVALLDADDHGVVGRDVGMPLQAPPGTISGWDMARGWIYFEPSLDRLYVGLQTFGIGGDADGDGDPDATSPWLDGIGGMDGAMFETTESFALMIDVGGDGTFDVIAGVPAMDDLSGYTVALFDGSAFSPAFAFGADLPLHVGWVHAAPSADQPHIEFVIEGISLLPGFDDGVGLFGIQAYMGSLIDGGIGEDFIPNTVDMSLDVCLDSDGDGFTTCEGDCRDFDPWSQPGFGIDEICDGIDSDCDGETDEAFVPDDTTCGVGACAATGTSYCPGGTHVADTCTPGTPAANDATCDLVDDDCDGAVDEDFFPQRTVCGLGACRRGGATFCDAGSVGDSCSAGIPAPDDAQCDGIDNDCDGATDEDFASTSLTCGVGACQRTGSTVCGHGSVIHACYPGRPAADDDTCDGIDDDCDGVADEDCECATTIIGTWRLNHAVSDPCNDTAQDHALWIPGFFDADPLHLTRWHFGADGGHLEWTSDGVATVTGAVTPWHLGGGPGDLDEVWEIALLYEFRGSGASGFGAEGPKKLAPTCQTDPVTLSWHFFDLVEGLMTNPATGEEVTITQYSEFPMQLGEAANGLNGHHGFAQWLLIERPSLQLTAVGDINVDMYESPHDVCDDDPAKGHCCDPHEGAGCNDAETEACLCNKDPYCCIYEWDEICVELTNVYCDACGGFDNGDCCTPNGSPGCEGPAVQQCVCEFDSYCCLTAWDQLCVSEADTNCSGDCETGSWLDPAKGVCNEANGTPGCEDPIVEGCVCALDSYCCSDAWDWICLSIAKESCGTH